LSAELLINYQKKYSTLSLAKKKYLAIYSEYISSDFEAVKIAFDL
jgi:hypothetical protein